MTFHLSHIHDYERFIAVEIGSYRVRTGSYSIESLQPILLGSAYIRQNKKDMLGGTVADIRSVTLTIERSLIQASQSIQSIPRDAIVGFSSSRFISDSITTQYIRKSGTPITMSEIDEMVKNVEKNSFDRVRTRAKSMHGIIYDDLKLISSTITAIELDGRLIMNPIGFEGKKVRLSILNIFAPASEFNIIRSIASYIDKNIISLIPIPLVFPKLLEKTDYMGKNTCIIDVGLSHTSCICIRENSIIAVETFPFGSDILMQLIHNQYKELTALQVEHMLSHNQYDSLTKSMIKDFFDYLGDTLQVFIEQNTTQFDIKYLFCHGSIFESENIKDIFFQEMHTKYDSTLTLKRFSDILNCDTDQVVIDGLADMATELLMTKKDPLIRILRYVLYNYE